MADKPNAAAPSDKVQGTKSLASEGTSTLPGGGIGPIEYDYDSDSDQTGATYASFTSGWDDRTQRPFRLPGDVGPLEPVYEAWTLYERPPCEEVLVEATRLFGIEVKSTYAINSRNRVTVLGCTGPSQAEVINMHLTAVEKYNSGRKSVLSRLIGKKKTYEADLEDRLRKTPAGVQEELMNLIFAREHATKTPWRARAWTVVAMSEIMRNSFTVMEPVEAETHRFRTWKNHGGGQPIQFLCVLRGDEARVTEEVDNTTFTRNANPWKHVDRREARMRDALRDRELEKRNPGVFAPLLPPVGSHPLYPTQWAMGSHPPPLHPPQGPSTAPMAPPPTAPVAVPGSTHRTGPHGPVVGTAVVPGTLDELPILTFYPTEPIYPFPSTTADLPGAMDMPSAPPAVQAPNFMPLSAAVCDLAEDD